MDTLYSAPYSRIMLVKPSGNSGLAFALNIIPLGIESIAAYIQDIVEDIMIYDEFMDKEPFLKALSNFKPDLVGFSMSATEHNTGSKLMKIVKKFDSKIPIIAGGYHPTGAPEVILNTLMCDAVCRGEGESLMKDFVQGKEWGLIDGLSYKDPLSNKRIIHNKDRSTIKDLDILPSPARDLRKRRGYHYKHELLINREYDLADFGRGCFGECTFCCEPYFSKGKQRFRSPEKMMENIREIYNFHKQKPIRILIADPHIMGQFRKLDRLCDLLIEADLDITFQVMSRTETIVKQPKTVEKMIKAGMISWEIGVESPIQDDLSTTSKNIPLETQARAIEILSSLGAGTLGTFVIGLPSHTKSAIKKFPSYARKIGVSSAAFGIAAPFPGTPFWDELDSQGAIYEKNWDRFDENNSVFNHPELSSQEIEKLRDWCFAKFWNFDTIFDQIRLINRRVGKFRYKNKIKLRDFMLTIFKKLIFGMKAAVELTENGEEDYRKNYINFCRFMFDAWADPRIEKYFSENPMHELLDMRQFGRLFKSKCLQLVIEDRANGKCLFAIKIDIEKEGIRSITVSKKPASQFNLLLRVDINCLYLDLSSSKYNHLKTYFQILLKGCIKIKGFGLLFKLGLYGLKEFLSLYLDKKTLSTF